MTAQPTREKLLRRIGYLNESLSYDLTIQLRDWDWVRREVEEAVLHPEAGSDIADLYEDVVTMRVQLAMIQALLSTLKIDRR